MHFVTIATNNYLKNTRRLVNSLRKHYPSTKITVFVENEFFDPVLAWQRVSTVAIPEIKTLGVKRAKFTAYSLAAKEGGFIYLDSDIIILKELDALHDARIFTSTRDDLSQCPFIEDPTHPWEHDFLLKGDMYFNSGVFSAPASLADFFDKIKEEASIDREWARYTIPGKLYDNHFLCAKIKQHRIPIQFASEFAYNWQGFSIGGAINCSVGPDRTIVCKTTNETLRLVHFAGIPDIDAALAGLDPDILQILARASGADVAVSGVLEIIHQSLMIPSAVDDRYKTIMLQATMPSQRWETILPGSEIPILAHAEHVCSIAMSTHKGDLLWNGFPCGNAYLAATEYQKLRGFLIEANIDAVLEFGAGYTTVLFHKLIGKQVALEAFDGPWLEYAQSEGAKTELASFSQNCGFDEEILERCACSVFSNSKNGLVFIDSPQGTANRALVIEQVIKHACDADFFAIHDTIRDATNVYRLASALRLVVVEHFASFRGLTFLARPDRTLAPKIEERAPLEDRMRLMRFTVEVIDQDNDAAANIRLRIRLLNDGLETITAASDNLGFSLHLLNEHREVLCWDTPRYRLPVDLLATDSLTFWIDMTHSSDEVTVVAFDLVREHQFWWSQLSAHNCPAYRLTKRSTGLDDISGL